MNQVLEAGFFTKVTVYGGTCGNSETIICSPTTATNSTAVLVETTADSTYLIYVYATRPGPGAYELKITTRESC